MPAILPLNRPNWIEPPTQQLKRTTYRFKPPTTGMHVVHPRPSAMMDVFPYNLTLEGQAEIATVVAWFRDTAKGRARSIWVPSYHNDLLQAGDHLSGFTELTIYKTDYVAKMLPHESRRHLAFMTEGSPVMHRRVEDAIDNGDGTETLTLNAPVDYDFPEGRHMISYLRLMRLSEDRLSIAYTSPWLAEVQLPFTEIPNEVPPTMVNVAAPWAYYQDCGSTSTLFPPTFYESGQVEFMRTRFECGIGAGSGYSYFAATYDGFEPGAEYRFDVSPATMDDAGFFQKGMRLRST